MTIADQSKLRTKLQNLNSELGALRDRILDLTAQQQLEQESATIGTELAKLKRERTEKEELQNKIQAKLKLPVTSTPVIRGGCDNIWAKWKQDTQGLNCKSTWGLTARADKTIKADEDGCGRAQNGAATFNSQDRKLKIMWKITDACKGYYDWNLDKECLTGTGKLVFESTVPPCKGTLSNSKVEKVVD